MWRDFKFTVLLASTFFALGNFAYTILKPSPELTESTPSQPTYLLIDILALFSTGLARMIDPEAPSTAYFLTRRLRALFGLPQNVFTQPLVCTGLVWLRFQFILMDAAGISMLLMLAAYLPYTLANHFILPIKRMDATRCRHGTGAVGSRNDDCLYCWDEIRADQNSVEHIQCMTFFHEGCLQEWIAKGAEVTPTCPHCRSPLSDNGNIQVKRGAAVCLMADLALLLRRCAFITIVSAALWALALTSATDNLPLEDQLAIRVTGVMTLYTCVWLTCTIILYQIWVTGLLIHNPNNLRWMKCALFVARMVEVWCPLLSQAAVFGKFYTLGWSDYLTLNLATFLLFMVLLVNTGTMAPKAPDPVPLANKAWWKVMKKVASALIVWLW